MPIHKATVSSLYLDYAATTPVDPKVIAALLTTLDITGAFGNASSHTHSYGAQAKELIEGASSAVLDLLNVDSGEVIWTSGATESNNLALQGLMRHYEGQNKHIITTTIEHKAVSDVIHYLETRGFSATYVTPDNTGLIHLEDIVAAIRPETILISIHWVNNELGTIQSIPAIASLAQAYELYFHVDAAQALGKISLDLSHCPIDMLSLSGHKAYAPKGIGVLYLSERVQSKLHPLFFGGKQQLGLRPGTLPTHQIVAMGMAMDLIHNQFHEEEAHAIVLRQLFLEGLEAIAEFTINGDLINQVPHMVNLTFNAINGSDFLSKLQTKLAISQGSACQSSFIEPSHVLSALGLSQEAMQRTFRFSWGRFVTYEDIKLALQIIKKSL